MSAPSPRDDLRLSAAKLAAVLGFPAPDSIDMKWDNHPPLTVLCRAAEPPKLTRNESLVYQAIRQAEEPLQAKEIETIVDRGHTLVSNALKRLREAGLIIKTGRDGYLPKGSATEET